MESELASSISLHLNALENQAGQFLEEKQQVIDAKDKEIEELKAEIGRLKSRLDLVIEQADAVKPSLQTLLLDLEGHQIDADTARHIDAFCNFTLPTDASLASASQQLDLDALKAQILGQKTQKELELERQRELEQQQQQQREEELRRQHQLEADRLAAEAGARARKQKQLRDGEEVFNDEVDVSNEVEYWDANTYGTIKHLKPATSNTVRRTKDPKNPDSLQPVGYRFEIRYDQLAPGAPPPSYHILPDVNDADIIRFRAGIPYQDLCYRISSRPWHTDADHGFVCSFDNKVFVLEFNLNLKN